MPAFKAFITASRRRHDAATGQFSEERRVFPMELEAATLQEAQRHVRRQFVQEHNREGSDWVPEQVEVTPLDE